MKPSVSSARLADLLRKSDARIDIDAAKTYRELTVKLNGRGVVLRKEVSGSKINGSRKNVVRAGQLILSRIDARNGAIGVVPDDLHGAIVSNDFPCFDIDEAKAVPRYLHWVFQAPTFLRDLHQSSAGTTNRVRLNSELFLEMPLLLPSLQEQRRIAATIDCLASELQATLLLCERSCELIDSILERTISDLAETLSAPKKPLGTFLKRRRDLAELDGATEYSGVGTRMWGFGTYVHERRLGADFEAERYEVRPGQFIYNEVWAHKGALGVVGRFGANLVVSRHFHVFDVDWSNLDKGFLQRLFQSRWFWDACADGSVGTTGRGHMRRDHMMSILIPVPTIDEQRQIASELDKLQIEVDDLKRLQTDAAQELDALLPSILDRAFKGQP